MNTSLTSDPHDPDVAHMTIMPAPSARMRAPAPVQPTEIAFGWSRDATSWLSNSIRYLTRPKMSPFSGLAKWSHMFLVFRFPDGSAVIHEALMSEGWKAKPAVKLADWMDQNPEKHVSEIHWLPISTAEVQCIYNTSCAWIGTKSYARRQLAAFALAESLLGRWLGLSIQSGEDEVICSEGACMLVGEVSPAWDLRRSPYQSWDSVSPQATYEKFMSLERTP